MTTAEETMNGHAAYPVFAPNQVLTHGHLNNVVSYLEAQTRLTRRMLIGTGIVCGFQPSLNTAKTTLAVSSGCGVTTDGYLIAEAEQSLTHYRRADLSEDDLPGGVKKLKSTVFELFSSASPADVLPEENNPIVALGMPQQQGEKPLSDTISDMVALLLLDIEDEERDDCIYDCNASGVHRTLAVRALVLDPADADSIIRSGFDPDGDLFENGIAGTINRAYALPELCVRRFGAGSGFSPASKRPIDLMRITSLQAYVDAYARVSGSMDPILLRTKRLVGALKFHDPIGEITRACRRANELFSPLFSSFQPQSSKDFSDMEEMLTKLLREFSQKGAAEDASERIYGIQYFHAHLKDLVQAYEDLRMEAFDLMDDCGPPSGRFPRHLMLGVVGAAPECPPSIYRTEFSRPPVYNDNARRLQRVKQYYERLRTAGGSFMVPQDVDEREIRVTPSRLPSSPLGERAIPYYYDPEGGLHKWWNFDRSRRCRADRNHSYHSFEKERAAGSEDALLCDIDGYDFFRIEGHIGKEYSRAIAGIDSIRHRFNLPFDLIALKISVVEDSEDVEIEYVVRDLELLYATCKERLVCALEAMNENGGGELGEPIGELITGLTLNKGDERGDFFDLTRLNENGHFDRFAELHTTIFESDIGREFRCRGCSVESVKRILSAYKERVREIRERLLFHKFAEHHPGMEHWGGVPRGGTFILVYVNEGEQGVIDRVRADILEKVGSRDITEFTADIDVTERVTHTMATIREGAIRLLDDRERIFRIADTGLEEIRESMKDIVGGKEISSSIGAFLEKEVAARTHTVVGDFCLPYVCCSKGGGVSFVISQPRPIVLLEDFSYCEDDPGTYDFIVHPDGGRLVGEGVTFESGHYKFVPNHPDVLALPKGPEGKREVTFTYTAEGGLDTLTIEILPTPDAGFVVKGLPESGIICLRPDSDDIRLPLIPAVSGGVFESDGPHVEEEDGTFFFNPTTVEPGTTIRITYRIPGTDDGCEGMSSQTVTVAEAPAAGFTGLDEAYCEDGAPVDLKPDTTGSDFSSEFNGEGVSFDDARGVFIFDPSLVDVAAEPREITIVHTVLGPGDCPGTATQTVTVYPRPDASFRFETALPKPLCVDPDSDGDMYQLIPSESGGTFTTEIGGATGSRALITEGDVTFFRPVDVLPDAEVTISYAIEAVAGCGSTAKETITVIKAPNAGITGLADSYCVDDAPVDLVPATSGTDLTSVFAGEGVRFDGVRNVYVFEPAKVDVGETSRTVTIMHTVRVAAGCSSTLRRSVTVHSLPDAAFTFEPDLPSPLCVAADSDERYQLAPATAGGSFKIEVNGASDTVGLVKEGDNVFFAPGELPPNSRVNIIYTVATDNGCPNTSSRTFVVRRAPEATFEPIPKTVLLNQGPIVLSPSAGSPTIGRFTTSFGNVTNTEMGIVKEGDRIMFDPIILLELNQTFPVQVTITYTVTEPEGCENSTSQTVVVTRDGSVPVPDVTDGGIITVVDGGFTVVDFGAPIVNFDLTAEATDLLTSRRTTYAETLGEVAVAEPEVTSSESFKLVNAYLKSGVSLPAADATTGYSKVISTALRDYQAADPTKRFAYEELIKATTLALLDRLSAEKATPELIASVSNVMSKIEASGIDVNVVKEAWQPEDLKSAMPAENVDRYVAGLP